MTLSILHPREDVLCGYANGTLDTRRRDRTAAHLRECAACQETLRFLTKLDHVMATPATVPPPAVLSRALEARAAGERRILPHPEVKVPQVDRPAHRRLSWVAALAAAIALIVAAVVSRPGDVAATGAQSEMRISPAKARPGDFIHVIYRPSPGLFAGMDVLVLRARLRLPGDDMYSFGVPVSRVHEVAMLHRSSNGDFTGTWLLPDSVAFISMVVEDAAAIRVDDNGGQLWEVLTYAADGRPTYDALRQRVNDLMGRSWEEAYATAKRMTVLYPDRYDSWSLRNFFDRALFGDAGGDSLAKAYNATAEALIAAARARPALSANEIGNIFFARRGRAYFRRGATANDTAEADYWLGRLLHEHPRHMQLAQHFAFDFTPEEWKRPSWMLDSLERLYARFAPLDGPGRNIVIAGMRIAASSKDDAVYRRWSQRSAGIASRGDSVYSSALALTKRPSLRHEGQAALRQLLASSAEAFAAARGLQEDRKTYLRRADDARRVALAELGRSLIADGRTREGLDTLGLAASGGWDPTLFRSLRAAYASAGDSAGVQAMRVRLAVDPRTPADSATAIAASERVRLGVSTWDSLVTSARREMHARLLDRASVRSLRGAPSLLGDDGKSHSLHSLAGNQPTAVIFWSRHCGWAIEALPSIAKVAERMTHDGKRVLFVVDEPPSADVTQYLTSRHWNLPVYYDARSEMRNAFSSFGTPAYYVIDGSGRIRFSGVDDEAELIAQVDALRAERGPN